MGRFAKPPAPAKGTKQEFDQMVGKSRENMKVEILDRHAKAIAVVRERNNNILAGREV